MEVKPLQEAAPVGVTVQVQKAAVYTQYGGAVYLGLPGERTVVLSFHGTQPTFVGATTNLPGDPSVYGDALPPGSRIVIEVVE